MMLKKACQVGTVVSSVQILTWLRLRNLLLVELEETPVLVGKEISGLAAS